MKNDLRPKSAPSVWRIGITGGIGSGKSYVCARLQEAGHRVFFCDDEAKRIIRTDPQVRAELQTVVGEGLYDGAGRLVKSVLAEWLCRGKEYSNQVDAIVHPRVADAFRHVAEKLSAEIPTEAGAFPLCPACPGQVTIDWLRRLPRTRVLFMECALLFESGFDRLVDTSVLVHVSGETQLRRLMERDKISREEAQAWIDLQLTEEEKLRRADWVLCND